MTTLQQLFFTKLSIYFIMNVASVCNCHIFFDMKIKLLGRRTERNVKNIKNLIIL